MAQLNETQRKLLEILADGLPHRPTELAYLLPSVLSEAAAKSNIRATGLNERETMHVLERAARENLRSHLERMRTVLRLRGEDIICELVHQQVHYRWVRLLKDPNDGKT